MLRKLLVVIGFNIFFFFGWINAAYATVDPFSQPNNKIGIHILFTTEVQNAAKLINSNGGDWGYVTIPIQSKDRDFKKWQNFMNSCKRYHVIPIVRLATEGDFTDSSIWRKPQLTDIIDFASFLNSLSWPTQNRYVIVFNEVNRADEWGGSVNPTEYANILSFAVTVFKSKSPDFFILSAGLDNAAPNQGTKYMDEYDFMRQMNTAIPAIFNQVDGLSSHSYPNPGFSQPPNMTNSTGVATFKGERDLAQTLGGKTLPIFITETGWSADSVPDEQRIKYYQDTFSSIWNDPGIVAITPFIFQARGDAFQKFSFLTATGGATKQYQTFTGLTKIKGTPALPIKVLAAEIIKPKSDQEQKSNKGKTGFSFSNVVNNVIDFFQ